MSGGFPLKKTLILIVFSVLVLCVSGCSAAGTAATAPQAAPQEATPNIIYVTATEETPNIIYVTATPETKENEPVMDPAISNDLLSGKIVYSKFLSHEPVDKQIFAMNLAEGVEKQITSNGVHAQPMWSPDGTKIMYTAMSGENTFDIYIMDENGENGRAIISTEGSDGNAVWSPDGKMIAYNSDVDGNIEIYTLNLETNETRQITHADAGYSGAPSWSPDGKKIVYVYGDGIQQGTHLFVYDIERGVSEEIDADKFYADDMPVWSPDGGHIVFQRMNGEFSRLYDYDLNLLEEGVITEGVFPGDNMETRAEKSAHGNFISFSENGKFYVMDMSQHLIYPLGVDAADLHYFPE
jgi:Tol biopolymer transport system component